MKHLCNLVIAALVLSFILPFSSCKPKDNTTTSFDSKAMLTNTGNNIIIPAYRALQSAATGLDSATLAFNQNATAGTLVNLQAAFKNACRAWQACSPYEFGPAEQQIMRAHFNTFPTDTLQINANITGGSYNLDALANFDAQGFPALDYLLFGLGTDNSAILNWYTVDTKAAARKAYLTALVTDIKTRTNTVFSAWSPTGSNYVGTFQNSEGVDIGSATGSLVNQLNFDLEIIKNNELGIPLGKQTMGSPLPHKVQAYYSGISAELALLHIKALQAIYLGQSDNGNGAGLDDCLTQLNAQYTNGPLNDVIKNQFNAAIAKVQVLSDPLSTSIGTNAAAANDAYNELQKLTVLLKTDMPSAMSVLITYVDTDGD